MNFIIRSIAALFVIVILSGIAMAATFTVNKTADTNDGTCDADCSLREAVVAANAAAGPDVIDFSSLFSTQQTITLGGTDLIITSGGLTITGPGASLLTVSGNNASRVFTNNTAAVTTISGITVTGGNGVSTVTTGRGGGVYNNAGTLTLQAMIITGNSAPNGGGSNNAGTATMNVIGCVYFNNTATTGSGGAMQNFSGNTLNISNSSIYSNTSNSTSVGGSGVQANGTVNISNSTIANNNAVGGSAAIYFNGTVLTLNNVTVIGNTATTVTGGINKSGANPVNIRNSIVSGNTGPLSPDFNGAATSFGRNIIGNIGTSSGWIGTDQQNVNPQLGTFGANAGFGNSAIPTPGSPAIDAGDNCVVDSSCGSANPTSNLTTDQRGIARPANGTVDIGAVEAANARVRGTVRDALNQPVRYAVIELSYPFGTLIARTNQFGRYFIDGVQVGNSITVNVSSKAVSYPAQNALVSTTDFQVNFGSVGVFKGN